MHACNFNGFQYHFSPQKCTEHRLLIEISAYIAFMFPSTSKIPISKFLANFQLILGELGWPEGPSSGHLFLFWKIKNPSIDFLVVIMASGIASGRVLTTTAESRKMGAIVQLIS